MANGDGDGCKEKIMKLNKLDYGHEYRGCEIHGAIEGYYWTGPDFDVDMVDGENKASGGHGNCNSIEDCQSDIDDWVVEDKMSEIKDSLKDFTTDEGMEILGWVMENLR